MNAKQNQTAKAKASKTYIIRFTIGCDEDVPLMFKTNDEDAFDPARRNALIVTYVNDNNDGADEMERIEIEEVNFDSAETFGELRLINISEVA